jgi:thymidine kinase
MYPDNTPDIRQQEGWIEVIAGSMFSGKTEELIRRLKRAKLANLKIEVFRPAVDTRYSENKVVSHDENFFPSTTVEASFNILLLATDAIVVGIDEAQFFDSGLPDVCKQLAGMGKRVIVAGLDMDYKASPFGPMPQLMAVAEYVTKLHAICSQCGGLAQYSHRTTNEKEQVVVGEKDHYEPLCRKCYNKLYKPIS